MRAWHRRVAAALKRMAREASANLPGDSYSGIDTEAKVRRWIALVLFVTLFFGGFWLLFRIYGG